MDRQEIIRQLQANMPQIRQFGVKSLALFGSVARDQARSDSDLDILVVFSGSPTFNQYMDLKFFLEELTGQSVDLVTDEAVRPQLRETIEQDALYVTA